MYSYNLFSPAPTQVLLHIYQQWPIYSDHFIISCSDLSASLHAWIKSYVLWHSIVSCSNPSASSNLSTVFHVLWSFYHLLLRLHFFSTWKSHGLCTPIILFSPAPTLVLLQIIHVLQLFNISCTHCSASPHVWAKSYVLQYLILSCSNPSASAHRSVMSHVLWSFCYPLLRPQCFPTCMSQVICALTFYCLLWPQCFSTCISHILCAPTFYSLLLQSQCFSASILNNPYTPII